MSTASDLIERAEREAGKRWDEEGSNAIAILMGALSRKLGQHNFQEKDDLAVGLLIQDDIAHGKERQQQKEALLALLSLGLSPDDIHSLSGKK